jgi:hypothetical protein
MYQYVLYSKQVSSWLSEKATDLKRRLGTSAGSTLARGTVRCRTGRPRLYARKKRLTPSNDSLIDFNDVASPIELVQLRYEIAAMTQYRSLID